MEVNFTSKRVKNNDSLTVTPDIQALAADFVKVMIDRDTDLCTFLFFKKHVKPVKTEQGITFDGIHEEAFLEVKVPFTTAFALSIFMNEIMKDIRRNPDDKKTVHFGPVSIKNG